MAIGKQASLTFLKTTIMKLGTIVTSSFVLSFIIALIGAWLKIIHCQAQRLYFSLVSQQL